jgi:hypothetical protein
MEKTSCIADVHRIVVERNGVLTQEDEQRISNLLKVKNTDVSIEKVTFKNHQNYF